MNIYTRTGDKGETSLVGGERISKDDIRIHTFGTCDEANTQIGFALSLINDLEWEEKEQFMMSLFRVQTILFHVGSELSTPKEKQIAWTLEKKHIDELEEQIDEWDRELPPLTNFILPYGNTASTSLQVARTTVRKAERLAVSFSESIKNKLVLQYLNRLSDFLFVAARYVNFKLKGDEKILFNAE